MYIVWRKQEYEELWKRFDCATREEVSAKVLELVHSPGDIEVTTPLAWRVAVNLGDTAPVAVASPEPPPAAPATVPEEATPDETP